jgi:hypothetical protein
LELRREAPDDEAGSEQAREIGTQMHANQSVRVEIRGKPIHSANLRFARALCQLPSVIYVEPFASIPRIGGHFTQGDESRLEPWLFFT